MTDAEIMNLIKKYEREAKREADRLYLNLQRKIEADYQRYINEIQLENATKMQNLKRKLKKQADDIERQLKEMK